MVHLPGIPQQGALEFEASFVIDTGASDSCLHPRDAIGVGRVATATLRDPLQWFARRDHAGIGGSGTYYIVICTYFFQQEDGTGLRIEGSIDIARPLISNLTMPSVLGWDVLQYFALRLDWSQRLIELS